MSEKLINLRCHLHGFGKCENSHPSDTPSKEYSNVVRRHRDKEEIAEQLAESEEVE